MTAVDASLWSEDATPQPLVVYESIAGSCWSDSTWGGEAVPLVRRPREVGTSAVVESSSVASPTAVSPTPSTASCASSAPTAGAAAICKFFANGGCLRGDACPFGHDLTINATSDADATRGFVLTGQVVNLKQQSAAHAKTASMEVRKHHSMNPDAAPFVAPWASSAADDVGAGGYSDTDGVQYHHCGAAAADTHHYAAQVSSYHSNSRQPPLTSHHHASAHHYQARHHQHSEPHLAEWERGADYYRDGYAHDQQSAGGWGYDHAASHQTSYAYHHHAQQEEDRLHEYANVSSKWTPSGVFSTTADNGMTRDALAGYYDQAARYEDASSFHHRRLQAMRPPLQSASRGAGDSSASSQASFSEEEAADRTHRVGYQDYTASYGRKFQPYPLPEGAYHSAEAHRRLRNRSEI